MSWSPEMGDPRLYKLETAAERAVRERLDLERRGRWKGALAAQDCRPGVSHGSERASDTNSFQAWFGGHRF